MRKLLVVMFVVMVVSLMATTISYGLLSDVKTLNIWNHYGPAATVWNTYVLAGKYPSLYTYSDKRFDFIPALAEALPPDYQEEELNGEKVYTLTITMRKDAKWSNGEPITAHDVAFTVNSVLKLITEKGLGGNWASVYDPETVIKAEALDDYTVKFYFKKKSLAKVTFGALMGPVVNKNYWEPYVEEALKKDGPEALQYLFGIEPKDPSGGAFMVAVKRERGAYIQNNAIADYYDKGFVETLYKNGAVELSNPNTGYHFVGYGEPTGDVELKVVTGPYVDSIIYKVYQNKAAAIQALKTGDISFLLNPLGLQVGELEQLKGDPNIEITKNPPNGFRYIAFNMRRYPMNVKAFRQAFAYIVDREFLTQKLLQGTAIPIKTVIPAANSFWYNPNVKEYGKGMKTGERLLKAIEVLKAAGFSWDVEPKIDKRTGRVRRLGRGLKGPDGKYIKEIELLFPSASYDPLRYTAGLYIASQAKKIGIPVKAVPTGFNTIVQRVWDENYNFDIYMLGWGLSLYPDYVVDFFHSRRAGPGDFNTPGYNNPEFDKLADEFLAATDLDTARKLAFKLQEMLAEDLPYLVLFTTPIYEAYRKDQIEFPYTEILDGIQGVNGFPSTVKTVK